MSTWKIIKKLVFKKNKNKIISKLKYRVLYNLKYKKYVEKIKKNKKINIKKIRVLYKTWNLILHIKIRNIIKLECYT